ncbi:MAG: tetratricopeptide repeat protein [Verrucomicrobiales bacterium]|nr:tetratricopeptide repeat protein [Verrucomicrobiales bacterium]
MSSSINESEALREHWLERRTFAQSLVEQGNPQEAAESLADVMDLPSDPEIRVIAGETYGLVNPEAGLEILNAVLDEFPDNEEALAAKARIDETVSSASASDRSKWIRVLTPGERLRRIVEFQNRILALALGIGGTLLVSSLMLLVATPSPAPEPPRIIAIAPPVDPVSDLEEEKMRKFEKIPVPSAPKAGEISSQVITAAASSSLAVVSIDGIGNGIGMSHFGSNFGSSMDFGVEGGASAMFFGSESKGERFLFVLDASRSMRPSQVQLRNEELQRALNGIRGAQYQVLLFAGGAFFAEEGWGIDPANSGGSHGPTHFVSPHGSYKFSSKSIYDFNLLGPDSDFTPASWKRADSLNIRKSVDVVKKSELFTGTDWDTALEIAHMMKPPPDVIFFMSDGLDSDLSVSDILRNSRRFGNPKINVVAMQTDKGADGFSGIAEGSKGTYTIVNQDGEVRDGLEKPPL